MMQRFHFFSLPHVWGGSWLTEFAPPLPLTHPEQPNRHNWREPVHEGRWGEVFSPFPFSSPYLFPLLSPPLKLPFSPVSLLYISQENEVVKWTRKRGRRDERKKRKKGGVTDGMGMGWGKVVTFQGEGIKNSN